ncbi:hypothetical protein L873DRAFT_1819984 [Choiromyces venosus 120613-1]|uniref:3'-5' exonuclease domain-containing protein n=1 Tax=Choiromyces venosus 120613-1 TaxID=1336337 RepID=A0A3N4JBE7_9PEZI|nr:hypothetical protein L873DRAFT_1819984 [Choiromyces venosus 120613-1]
MLLSGHQTLAREFPFLCSSFRKVSTFGTTTSYPTICAGGGTRQICGRNFSWTSKPFGCQKLPSNATSNFNSSLGSHSENQSLLSGIPASTLGFTERTDRRSFSTSVSLLAQAGHEELPENPDEDGGGWGGRGREDTGSRGSKHNTQVTDNGRVLKVNTKTEASEIWKMIRAEVAKLLRSEIKGEIKGEINGEKVGPIPAEPVVEKVLKDTLPEAPAESPFVLQSSYADDSIEELKQPEAPEDNFLKQEQFVEQSSYSFFGLDLEEQGSALNTASAMGIPDSSYHPDERASEVTESEAGGLLPREIFGSGISSPRRVSEKKQVEIDTHSTAFKTPVPEKKAEKVVVTKTKERKKVIDIEKTETVAEVEATPKPKPSKSLAEFAEPLSWTELPYAPLTYQITEQTLLKKFSLRESSPLRYWCYDLYTDSLGKRVNVHYCKTIKEFDEVAKLFLDDRILGFDLEWVPSNFSPSKSAKVNASLMQLANETDIALFHIAKVPGKVPDFELIPPNLRKVLESEDIMKTGVSVTGDAKRVSKFLGVHPAGIFELSDLWNLVHDVRTMAGSITRRLIALSRLTEECLYLPLDKSASRISNWAVELSNKQLQYAANDAYAAFRVFDALEEMRHGLKPTPRFPGCRIIPPQEPPSDNDYPIIEEEVEEYDYRPKRINLDGPEVEMASSWATSFLGALAGSGIEAKAQHPQLKVYSLWHDGKHSVEKIAELCRNPPLKETTVVMHILEAIQLENLPYDDRGLAELRKRIPKPFMHGKYHWVFSVPDKDAMNGDVYLS